MDGVAPALRAGWLYFLRANGSSCPREWLSRDAFYSILLLSCVFFKSLAFYMCFSRIGS